MTLFVVLALHQCEASISVETAVSVVDCPIDANDSYMQRGNGLETLNLSR